MSRRRSAIYCPKCRRAVARRGPDGWRTTDTGMVLRGPEMLNLDGSDGGRLPDTLTCGAHWGWRVDWPPR